MECAPKAYFGATDWPQGAFQPGIHATMTLMTMVFGREKSFRLGESSFPIPEVFSLGLKSRTKYVYDSAGRLSADNVTDVGESESVDTSVLSIVTAYDDLGRVQLVSSYSYVSGVGDPVNQIERRVRRLGQPGPRVPIPRAALLPRDHSQRTIHLRGRGRRERQGGVLRLTDISYPNDPNG